ncbi:MAG: hypothetical protein R3F61_29200 [Myxococcota bacterium]
MTDRGSLPRPPGPVNPGALATLIVFGSALLPLGWLGTLFTFDSVECAQAVQVAPALLEGGLCGLISSTVIIGLMWVVLGGPSRDSVVEDEDGVEWERPRFAPALLLPFTFLAPVLIGMAGSALLPRAAGEQCTIYDFDDGVVEVASHTWVGTASRSCGEDLPPALQSQCSRARGRFAMEAAVPLGLVVLFGGLAYRSRRGVRRVEVDARGVGIDGERIAYADLDGVTVTEDALTLALFDGSLRVVPLYPAERALAQHLAERIRPMLPRDPEDRPAERARLTGLLGEPDRS